MKWIKKWINKKNKSNKMLSEEKLINYKQNFTGQSFQWIRTNRPELLGKVVKCRDIQVKGNSAFAVFDDGSSIDINKLNSDLLMISGDMKPLSKDEVASIYPQSRPSNPQPQSSGVTSQTVVEPKPETVQNKNQPKPEVPNPFEMFNSDKTDLNIKISINLPDKKLLKLMYNNAENKDEFLNQLSEYVYSSINNNVVKDSLSAMLVSPSSRKPVVKEKKETPEIKLTEVKDGE